MTGPTRVRVDFDDILRQVEANGHDEVHVEFVADAPHDADKLMVVAAAGDAVDVANGAVPDMIGGDPMVSVAGVSVLLRRLLSEETLAAWVDAFAGTLAVRELSGLVRATPLDRRPDWVTELASPRMTVFVSCEGALDAGDTGWFAAAVRWAAFDGAATLLSTGGVHQSVPVDGLADRLARALRVNGAVAVTFAGPPGGRVSRVQLNANGHVMFQEHDPFGRPAEKAARARDALLANCSDTRLGFVAMVPLWTYEWDARARALPALPTIPTSSVHVLRDNGDVWRRFVPDAHGMQLLSTGHQRSGVDLSTWQISEVAGGRLLVEARDLAEWLRPGGPGGAVLTAARTSFRPAIVPTNPPL
ncbi:hypothetical protein [Micromonospora endolithica]|uniref:hypothetical protein n=1 Tax=Micromonospora endolithica TaxID=230091 RepID=UPI0011AC7C55|nr:hypothetical protein [Micromonospora endolithica]TWJ23051.1 hypothetical protein JD76_03179 [Micromonospora endolithica]